MRNHLSIIKGMQLQISVVLHSGYMMNWSIFM